MRKAQISPEYIYLIAIIIVTTLVYIGLMTDSLTFVSSESDNVKFWRNMQVGILQITDNGDNTSIWLLNNHRENITINDVKLSNRSLSISGEIGAGEGREFISLETGFSNEVSIWMNYSIEAQDILFAIEDVPFKGVKN